MIQQITTKNPPNQCSAYTKESQEEAERKQEQMFSLTAAKKGEEAGKSFYGPTTKRRRSKNSWEVDEKANVVMSWQN